MKKFGVGFGRGMECAVPERQSYAQAMLDLSAAIAIRAEESAGRLHDKLMRVSLNNVLPPDCNEQTQETYPELWDEFRNNLRRIDAALNAIQNSTDRAEV